jgi:hypothetical protein
MPPIFESFNAVFVSFVSVERQLIGEVDCWIAARM